MTHNLLIYPSTLPGEPLERYSAEGVTLDQWLRDIVPSYQPGDQQPVSATVNGVVVEPSQWAETYITRDTVVELRPQPQGASLIVAAVVAAVAVAATILLRPSIPSQGNRRSTRGSSIYEANAQGNRPKLGDVIPEIAGRHKHYPDYLSAPRRYFVDPKVQALDLLLCVGKGEYDIQNDEIRIGSTPLPSLGGSVSYQIFPPGANVTGHIAHRRWYNAPEVGASVGSSGLRLLSTRDYQQSWDGSLALSGTSIVGGNPPEGWGDGTILRVRFFHSISVSSSNNGNLFDIDINYLEPTVGDVIRIWGVSGLDVARIAGISGDGYILERSIYVPPQEGAPGYSYWELIDDFIAGDYTGEVYLPGQASLAMRVVEVLADGLRVVPRKNGADVSGWDGFPSEAGIISVDIDQSQMVGVWTNAFLACPEGETTTHIEFDVLAPQGLGHINDDADLEGRSRTIELQYRPVGSSAWTTIRRTVSAATRDQIGWTWGINLPYAMTPEVRVRRTSAESNSTQDLDRLEWYGLRCQLPAKTSYPGVTVLALTLIGSDTIASQTENQVSVVATRRLPVRANGQWQPAQATRNIAPWIAYIAKSAGYTDGEIDFDELDRLDAIWQARGDYFDFVHDDDSTVKEALNRALRPGFTELTIDQGRIRPVRDEPRSTFEHMYTPQNMLGPLQRSVQAPRPDDLDGIDVEYFDDVTWTTETVECRLPGDQGVRAEKLRIEGVTNRTRAWRIGMRERRRQKYRRWTYSFSTELDALNSRYMSYCALADDIPGYAQSALVEGVEVDGPDVLLLSSEPLEWQEGKSHVIAWRRPDGTLAGPFPAQPGDDERHVIAQMDEVPVIDYRREPPHLLFGTTDEWSFPVLITSINPRGFESVSVDAVNYDERIYADDNGTPN